MWVTKFNVSINAFSPTKKIFSFHPHIEKTQISTLHCINIIATKVQKYLCYCLVECCVLGLFIDYLSVVLKC